MLSLEASDREPVNNPPMRTLDQWHAQIKAVLAGGLRGTGLETVLGADAEARLAYARAFADDAGHRRAVDPPLLAWVLGVEPWDETPTTRRDVRLWAALHNIQTDPLALIDTPAGPLAPEARAEGIEVWTEIELASLQALWWHAHPSTHPRWGGRLARQPARPEVRDRALSHARWLMDEIQPDNGTNRPWAAGVFAELAATGEGTDALDAALYAETLLHNCQVVLGKPDLLSTVLLLDASRLLAGA